jgi:hypothetical protein
VKFVPSRRFAQIEKWRDRQLLWTAFKPNWTFYQKAKTAKKEIRAQEQEEAAGKIRAHLKDSHIRDIA